MTSTSIHIIADDRERHVIQHLCATETSVVDIEVARLLVGDYAIVRRNNTVLETEATAAEILAVIERKTLCDLAASIRDGRLHGQCAKLRGLRKRFAETPPPPLIFLIEGNPFSAPERKYGGLPFKALLAKLDTLACYDGFGILWAKDEVETAVRLVSLAQTLGRHHHARETDEKDEKDESVQEKVEVEEEVDIVKQMLQSLPPVDDSEHRCRIAMLCCLRGVSQTTAKSLLRTHAVADILLGRVSVEAIAETAYHEGCDTKIGTQRAKRIAKQGCEMASTVRPAGAALQSAAYKTAMAVLQTVPRISKGVAASLLGCAAFEDLCKSTYDHDAVAKTKCGKRAIGTAVLTILDAVSNWS